MKNKIILHLVTCLILLTLPLSAQLKREGLIFSEAYLNEKEPDNSWIEIYNPTKIKLILEKFRTYDVLTTNILPKEIIEQGGFEINPGESIIICPDKSRLKFSNDVKIIQINEMRHLGKGGFFSMRTKGMGENGVDILRYGDPSKTSEQKAYVGDFVIPFITGTSSYTRIVETKKQGIYNFVKTEPTPGSSSISGVSNE